jgi:hypothetical protein
MLAAGSLLWTGCGAGSPPRSGTSASDNSTAQAAPVSDLAPKSDNADDAAPPPASESPESQAQPPADVIVAMENCKATRPGKITADTSVLKMIFSGPPKDKLVKRGTVQVDDQNYTLYLPKSQSYSTQNTESSDSRFENNSTLISVDHNGDGQLTDDESWFANLPLRLGDKMFEVAEIAADGSQIVLKPSQAPLRGVIVGRSCPQFSFKTADEEEVSLGSLAGKAFILDIWSFT